MHMIRRKHKYKYKLAAAAVLAVLQVMTPAITHASNRDPIGSIYAAAQNHGVDPGPLLRVARCESGFDPFAENGHYHGMYMLGDVPTGLLGHFHSVGYADPYDAEQVADYFARVVAGDFLPGGTTPAPLHPYGIVSGRRWSCW